MEEKINIAEILKDKQKGIRLYSPIFGECTFSFVREETDDICVNQHNGEKAFFNSKGLYYNTGEVMLFPSKQMRDWRKFFKKGDVLFYIDGSKCNVIFDKFDDDKYTSFIGKHYLESYGKDGELQDYEEIHFGSTVKYTKESEEAAQTYINTIEERLGGKLNRETLEIEKQTEFKDGDIITFKDRIIIIYNTSTEKSPERTEIYYHACLKEGELTVNEYLMSCGFGEGWYSSTEEEKHNLFEALSKKGKAWDAEKKQIVDLKPKWTPKPFDRVITRTPETPWTANLFSHIDSDGIKNCIDDRYIMCLPYNDETAKLIGTTNNWRG